MKRISLSIALMLFISTLAFAQESGNRAYATPRRKPLVDSGVLTAVPDGRTQVYFVEANVLANMKADAYTAVFGVVQEGPASADSNSKTDAAISNFIRDLENLGIKR